MKKYAFPLSLVLCCTLFLAACNNDNGDDGDNKDIDYKESAVAFVTDFFDQKFDALTGQMTAQMQEAFDTAAMEEQYDRIIKAYGEVQSIDDSHEIVDGNYAIVYVNMTFANQRQAMQLAYDDEGKVAGFYIVDVFKGE